MTTILETKNLEMKFGAVYAAKDVNISIGAGEVMGVIGSNGAGKTTSSAKLARLLKKQGRTPLLVAADVVKDDVGGHDLANVCGKCGDLLVDVHQEGVA